MTLSDIMNSRDDLHFPALLKWTSVSDIHDPESYPKAEVEVKPGSLLRQGDSLLSSLQVE